MKILLAILCAACVSLSVGGCATYKPVKVVVEKPDVYIPSDKYFYCPGNATLPKGKVTDGQVADILIKQTSVTNACRGSLNNVHKKLYSAKARIESATRTNRSKSK